MFLSTSTCDKKVNLEYFHLVKQLQLLALTESDIFHFKPLEPALMQQKLQLQLANDFKEASLTFTLDDTFRF